MELFPALQPLAPALQGRYLALTRQGIPADIAAADMLGNIQEACYELPADAQPTMADVIQAVKTIIQSARHRLYAAAMS